MKKLSEIIASVENNFSARKARKIAHKQNEADFKTRKDFINSSEFMNEKIDVVDEVTTTQKITSATKLKVESDVFRYFLQDDTKKGVCSAQIKKICGKKAIWKRSLNGKKNQYVSGIEGMKSDKVDEVMSKFKNLETYFVKSPYKAKIWNRQ
jgi:hypothetical protein